MGYTHTGNGRRAAGFTDNPSDGIGTETLPLTVHGKDEHPFQHFSYENAVRLVDLQGELSASIRSSIFI